MPPRREVASRTCLSMVQTAALRNDRSVPCQNDVLLHAHLKPRKRQCKLPFADERSKTLSTHTSYIPVSGRVTPKSAPRGPMINAGRHLAGIRDSRRTVNTVAKLVSDGDW